MNTPKSAPSMEASKSASAKKMLGDLPPSSRVTRLTVSAACLTMIFPTAALPVKAILLTSACCTSGAPQVAPKPVMMFTTPGGRPTSASQLQHTGTTRGQRGRQLPGRHQQRIVPGNDLASNADWLFERQAHGVVRNGIYVSENLCGQTAVVLEARSDVVDIVFRFDDGLAGVAAFQFSQQGCVLANLVGQAEQYAASFLSGGDCPRTIFKCPFGGGNSAVDIVH